MFKRIHTISVFLVSFLYVYLDYLQPLCKRPIYSLPDQFSDQHHNILYNYESLLLYHCKYLEHMPTGYSSFSSMLDVRTYIMTLHE